MLVHLFASRYLAIVGVVIVAEFAVTARGLHRLQLDYHVCVLVLQEFDQLLLSRVLLNQRIPRPATISTILCYARL